jgi:RNA polymerase sigma factor (TIGR02999 family)
MRSSDGIDSAGANELLDQVYAQLRAAAQQRMKAERPGHTLSATALVHEAYLKLLGPRECPWKNRAHFYAAAVEAMRRILLDHAKAHGRIKRAPGGIRIDLDAAATIEGDGAAEPADIIALDEAVCRLRARDERMAEVVRLRYYAGLSVAETAAVLEVSEKTVKNDWAFAKAWLARELG